MPNFDSLINLALSNTNRGTSSNVEKDVSKPVSTEFNLVESSKLNYTDPIVRHDGGNHSNVAVFKDDLTANTPAGFNHEGDTEPEKIHGIKIPVVKVNNLVVSYDKILHLKLDYTDFRPKLELWIKDTDDEIKTQDMPTRNNIITIVIVPQVDGAYKKISIDFYTNTIPQKEGDIIKYIDCEYKLNGLYEGTPTCWKHSGCSSDKCSTSQDNKPTTFELFHDIAASLGLGYQTTEQVKEIQDHLPRNTQNLKLWEFMKKQISFGGLDENSLFDMWIDLYGYLTIVNVPWVLSQDIDGRYLGIMALSGIPNTSENLPDPVYKLVHRTIHNFDNQTMNTNLTFKNYEHVLDFWKLNKTGEIRNYYIFNRAGDPTANSEVGGNNIEQINVQASAATVDESDYGQWQHGAQTIVLTEQNEYPTATQAVIRDMYFTNLRTNMLKVELFEYNLGLQRGTLINLVVYNYDLHSKLKIATSAQSINGNNVNTKMEDNFSTDEMSQKDMIMNESVPLRDPSISGIYYIDGMEFLYNKEEQEIQQFLYLIPKYRVSHLTNAQSTPKIDPTIFEQNEETRTSELPDIPASSIVHF